MNRLGHRDKRHVEHGPAAVREPSQRASQRSQHSKRARDDDDSNDDGAFSDKDDSGTTGRTGEVHVAPAAAPQSHLQPARTPLTHASVEHSRVQAFHAGITRGAAQLTVNMPSAAACPCCLQGWPPGLDFRAQSAAYNATLMSMAGGLPWEGGSPAAMPPIVSAVVSAAVVAEGKMRIATVQYYNQKLAGMSCAHGATACA